MRLGSSRLLQHSARIPSILFFSLCVSCTTGPMEFPEPLLGKRAEEKEKRPVRGQERAETSSELEPPPAVATRFAEVPAMVGGLLAGVVDSQDKSDLDDSRADIRITLEDVELPAFINEVFGNVLGLSFEIASELKDRTDRVSVRLEQSQTRRMVYEMASQILSNYGVEIQRQGELLRFQIKQVGLSPDEPPILISGEARPEVPIAYRPVFQFVNLQRVDAKDVIPWLNSAYEKSGLSVSADPARSGLMLKGMSSIVRQASEAVRLLDQPFMRGRHSMRIDPAFVTASDMAGQLRSLLAAQGYSVSVGETSGSIVLVPLESSNALIVFANDHNLLALVREWSLQVDRVPISSAVVGEEGGAEKESLFFYEARNTRVTELAKSLRALVSGFTSEGAYGITSDLKSSASRRAVGLSVGGRARDEDSTASVSPLLQAAGAAALVGGGQGKLLDGLVSDIRGSGTIVEDENRNAILFRGSARTWQQMQELLRQMDKPARQVLIEVTVASVSLSDTRNLGTEWSFASGDFSNAKLTGAMGKSGFSYVINTAGGNKAAIAAMAKDQRVRVLATPRILVKSGEQANINVGSDIPVPTAQSVDNSITNGNSNLRNEIAYRSTGTILNVAPVVYSNSRIDLTVSQELSDGGGDSTTDGKGNVTPPIISRTSLETALTLKSGGSVLMGGLIRDSVSDANAGVPYLKDLPLIGGLFGAQEVTKNREEVILLIQPYVLESDQDAKEVTDKLRSMLERSLACSGRAGQCVSE